MSDVRILIVEDDPFIAMDIEALVAELAGDGAELVVVESVAEARRQAQAELSCALLDIDVVGGKTFVVAESLLERGTPFAFVSGSPPKDVPEPLRHVTFLRKPFTSAEIGGFVAGALLATEASGRIA